ncbi:glutamate racemase [Holzapfeliella floricola]|uniref:Glutamate racemase n=1 Tax=Holzapfeliella floricola DSM 23037 = JCM 16512 TaxID=1423744 RepID=A0A0R2DU95_9LACO|nr:glutamate racemase [Holzapfeliella floricola]KRN04519.1 glutamate racemase [Holzapfeliella floricola DSM 23037 = JCM 16512]
MDNRPIGLLDSGLGGLSVLKQVKKILPRESTIYIGDQAHLPYGNKSVNEIIQLTKKLVDFLIKKDVKLIVFACNTATATAMTTIQQQVDIPIIGVISAGSMIASAQTKTNKIAVIATQATIKSGAYEKALKLVNNQCEVISLATPQLVPAIENNVLDLQPVIHESLQVLQDKCFDTLILGCTHYPLIQNQIAQELTSQHIEVVDPAEGICQQITQLLKQHDAFASHNAHFNYGYTTGSKEAFEQAAQKWLGQTFDKIKQVKL